MPPPLSLFIFLVILRAHKAKWKLVLLFSMKTQNLITADEYNKCRALASRVYMVYVQKVT